MDSWSSSVPISRLRAVREAGYCLYLYQTDQHIDDLDEYRTRPAVCLTKPIGQYDIIVAFVTTKTQEGLPTDTVFDAQDSEFSKTNFHSTSCIKLNKLVSISLVKLQGKIGILPQKQENEAKNKLLYR
jgi:mRNA interferase MazF